MYFRQALQCLLITAILLYSHPQLALCYTQVSTSGAGHGDDGPKIYKALNFDLVFPKSFNSSGNITPTTPSALATGSPAADVDDLDGRQQYNPLPQSNEQTNRDNDDVGDNHPLYITPIPNEDALYQTHNASNNYNNNVENNAQVVTQNPINIQQQLLQQNNNNNNNVANEQQNIATGRAVDYRTGYPFGQLITPLIKNAPRPGVYSSKSKPIAIPPSSSPTSNVGKLVVYPQAVYQRKPPSQAEVDKLRGRGTIKDRFTPSEAVASHQIKANSHNHNHDHHHNHAPTYTVPGKVPAASNVVNSYVPPKNLYSFPPNNINYPSPTQDNKLALPTNVVNSYSPPASGPLKDTNYALATASSDNNGYKYAGPLNLSYLPSVNSDDNGGDTKDQKDNDDGNGDGDADTGDGDNGNMDDSIGVLPASAMDSDSNTGDMDSMGDMKDAQTNDDHSYDTEKEYPTPPPEWLKAHPEAANEHPPHDHDNGDDHHHDEHHSDITLDHDHHHDHHHPDIILGHDPHLYSYHHSFPIYPHYPEIIYDDHHDHHPHHVEPPPTTTEAPPPEPPPEPRVKKYSYFYIGRKLWYIPLYFTIWFSFYVLWLILKSIARHKVNLPNHYVSRRSVDNYNLSKNQQELINQLTISVMDKIDKFKRKHLS